MLATYAMVTAGEDEWSLMRRLADNIIVSGAERVAFNHLNSGPNPGFPHAAPSGYRVQKGEMVKADSGGFYDDYIANVGRTAKRSRRPGCTRRPHWRFRTPAKATASGSRSTSRR